MTLCHTHRKSDPFVRLDKRIVFDSSISWKAKGILAYAFSRPDDWTFYKCEMIKHASDGETSFDSGIKELENAGYLHRSTQHETDSGRFNGLEWHFFEEPISGEEFKKVYRNGGFPGTGVSPVQVKPGLTKKENTTKKDFLTVTADAGDVRKIEVKGTGKTESITTDDLYLRIAKEHDDWTESEIQYAWNALAKYAGIVHNWYSFLRGTVQKHRTHGTTKKQNKIGETKCKTKSKQQLENIKQDSSDGASQGQHSQKSECQTMRFKVLQNGDLELETIPVT